MARANAERFIEAAVKSKSAVGAPDPTLCPRCQRPLMDPFGLGLCSACGYCHSLQTARAQHQAEAEAKEKADKNPAIIKKKSALGEWAGIFDRLPEGSMVPLGGALAIICVALFASTFVPATAPIRWSGGLFGMVMGCVAIAGAHLLAQKMCNTDLLVAAPKAKPDETAKPAKKSVGPFAVVEIWRTVLAEMPDTKLHLGGAAWGAALVVSGVLFLVPSLNAERESQAVATKLEAREQAQAKRAEEKKAERQVTNDRLKQLNGQPGKPGFTSKPVKSNPTPVQPGDPPPAKPKLPPDSRPTVPCVILGYTTNSSKQLTGLVLGSTKEGKVVFAGLTDELEADQRVALEVKLSGLKRSDPLVEIPDVTAVWVKPAVFCEVHQSGITEAGRLDKPRFRALIEE